jgi:hypothetical protein
MADKLWKAIERKVAKFFGTLRTPLSGSHSAHTRSDTLHDILYIETKLRERHTAVSLWQQTNNKAKKENKIPCVVLAEKGKTGFWLVVHSSDLVAVANQRRKIRKDDLNDDSSSPF